MVGGRERKGKVGGREREREGTVGGRERERKGKVYYVGGSYNYRGREGEEEEGVKEERESKGRGESQGLAR